MQAEAREAALAELFTEARSFSRFLERPVAPAVLQAIYDSMKWGPTSMNCQPLRIRFLVSPDRRQRLADRVYESNRAKVLSAPVCAVLGMDMAFPETLPQLFPHKADARAYFAGKPALVDSTVMRNASLQAGYFMLAARLLGLDCGPMSGFDSAQVDAMCWPEGQIKTNFLCNLGYGDRSTLFTRSPRLTFEQACRMD